jgi:diguanylate cyclase (GGDEF)-like protein
VVSTPVVSTPVLSTPITAPPLVTPTGPSVTPVTPSLSDRVTISQLAALGSGRGGAGRPGAVLSTGRSATALLLGSPLTLSLAPAQTGGLAASVPTTTVLSHAHQGVKVFVQPPSSGPANDVAHFIGRIPAWIWIALAAAIGFGAVAAGAAVRSGRRARRRADEVAAVTATASTDQLTGVLNRRGFTDSAERELDRARRYGRPLALAYIDVRGLKAVNDSEGHLAGDHVLREVAVLLSESARAHDLVGRMGGDELAVLLAEQEDSGAAAMTRRVREQVPNHRAALGLSTDWDVTIGTASFPDDGDTLDELVAVADRRLYEQRGIELR